MTINGTVPTIHWRPSFLPVQSHCDAAGAESAGKVDPGNDLTAKGKAIHAAIQRVWEDPEARDGNGKVSGPDFIAALAREFGVKLDLDETNASILYAIGWLHNHMPRAECEVNVGPGTVDVLQIDLDEQTFEPKRALVADWKGRIFGKDEADESYQQIAYVVAIADKYKVDNVSSWIVYHAQEAATTRVDYGPAEIQAAREELARLRARAEHQATLPQDRRDYRDGPWCSYCKGAATCPALVARGQAVGTMLAAISGGQQITLDEATLPSTWAAVNRLVNATDDFKSLVKRVMEARNGESIIDATGELRWQKDKLPAPKPKYEAAIEALMKRDPELGKAIDREVHDALPPAGGFKAPYAKLYPTKKPGKGKKEIDANV